MIKLFPRSAENLRNPKLLPSAEVPNRQSEVHHLVILSMTLLAIRANNNMMDGNLNAMWLVSLLFMRRKLKVDIRELEGETETLSNFLTSKLRIDVAASENELSTDFEKLSPKELKTFVNKFIYHQNPLNRYWVALTGNVVGVKKFKKFKHSKNQEKKKGKGTRPSAIKHGW